MATGGGKVGGVDGRVLDVLMRTGGVLVSPPEYFPDSEDEASSEEAAGPSGSRRHPPATTAFMVSGPAAVAGPSGLTQPPATPQVLRPTTQVPQPTPQVPQPTPQA
nr:atrophin-1-like [Dermacentor andersoni]